MSIMKKITLIILISTVTVFACKKRPTLEPKPSNVEGISATWTLNKVQQIDVNNALAFVESDTLLDVTKAIIKTNPLQLKFSSNGDFSITNAGDGSKFFAIPTANWNFDDINYPTAIKIKSTIGDSAHYQLAKPIRPQDANLVLKYNKICSGNRTVAYLFWFNRN